MTLSLREDFKLYDTYRASKDVFYLRVKYAKCFFNYTWCELVFSECSEVKWKCSYCLA